MQIQRLASTALVLLLLLLLVATGMAQEGATITWESYKEAEFDFGDNLLRVGSDYETYAWATGAPTSWTSAYPGPEITEITAEFTTDFNSSEASAPKATASAVTGWLLHKDDASGIATLSNAAAGTTAIVDKYDPTATAMSWAAQSTSLDLGEEVSQGQIDWSPGILVSASGGSFASSYDLVSIHDPIVVWTRTGDSDVIEPTTLFELTAEFDSKTEIHWNEVRAIQAGIDGTPELVVIPNDGPFLDARGSGSGKFRIRLDSDLLTAEQRGTLAVDFKDGIVTASTATGVFSDLAPREDALETTLPDVGSPARIESILVDNNVTGGRFALNIDVGQDRVISDVAACSDGVHISVGPAVDTIQTFTLNPMQRSPITQVSVNAASEGLPGPCLGDVRDDADLLFGNTYSSSGSVSLQPESHTNPIDRFLRLDVSPNTPQQTLVFDRGENTLPADTRRWTATFDARLSHVPPTLNVEPIDEVPLENAVEDGPQPLHVGDTSTTAVVGGIGTVGEAAGADGIAVIDSTKARFAIGLIDAATFGTEPAIAGDVAAIVPEISLFREADGVVLTVIDGPDQSIARLAIDGRVIREADIPSQDRLFSVVKDRWRHFELGLEQQHAGIGIQLKLVGRDGDDILSVINETIPDLSLSPDGYRLAIGSFVDQADLAHDFDNLVMTFQQTGDVAWDGTINAEDFHVMHQAIDSQIGASIFDMDLNGQLDFADLELIEDLIPNKITGDTNFDGMVNFVDFIILVTSFGETTGLWSRGDFDSNGRVEFKDFIMLSQNFGAGVNTDEGGEGAVQPVPEPSCVALLMLGVLALGRMTGVRGQRS